MSPDRIRTLFSGSMSEMYRAQVPQYGTLMELVAAVNEAARRADPALDARLLAHREIERLDLERHGAIRLGTAGKLSTMRRLFAVMGMVPVGYYDLSVAGVPVHSTAFQPVEPEALRRNPFRVFTSLLRLHLVAGEALRAEAAAILARRFEAFPDDKDALRRQELAFFRYRATGKAGAPEGLDLDALVERGFVAAEPITYEDFLPVSAAGIFQSNLGDESQRNFTARAHRDAFVEDLGAEPADEIALYAKMQSASIAEALQALRALADV
ncbi:DUF1338 family protein [Aureimonas sp. ME7]|uniref:2-oxoadipate dioxygenase/decarboxylase family protein n=1 Tax=Aureimonas sp. ME7 TaxID=2744252 RepID=UPI0015F569BB|nr:DUF1338 family protein [Aureimonas sp. ME7]